LRERENFVKLLDCSSMHHLDEPRQVLELFLEIHRT
jgi:hypothetical protein